MLTACKNDDEKAREHGFENFKEQQKVNALGFKTKKDFDESVRKEAIAKANRFAIKSDMLKHSYYCYNKLLVLNRFVFTLGNAASAFACTENEMSLRTHGQKVDEINSEIKLSQDTFAGFVKSIETQVEAEFSNININGAVAYKDLEFWAKNTCGIEPSEKAKKDSILSGWCNKDNFDSPFSKNFYQK